MPKLLTKQWYTSSYLYKTTGTSIYTHQSDKRGCECSYLIIKGFIIGILYRIYKDKNKVYKNSIEVYFIIEY